METKWIFGVLRMGLNCSGRVLLSDGREYNSRSFAQEAKAGMHPDVVLVRAHYATGNGLAIGRATTEEFYHPSGGGWFLPAKMTRGVDRATEEKLASVPDYVRAAYEWYWLGR